MELTVPVAATTARLLELSARLSAAREVSKALMLGEDAGEEAAGAPQMRAAQAF